MNSWKRGQSTLEWVIGAAIIHIRQSEYRDVVPIVALGAAAVLVAWGRFGS